MADFKSLSGPLPAVLSPQQTRKIGKEAWRLPQIAENMRRGIREIDRHTSPKQHERAWHAVKNAEGWESYYNSFRFTARPVTVENVNTSCPIANTTCIPLRSRRKNWICRRLPSPSRRSCLRHGCTNVAYWVREVPRLLQGQSCKCGAISRHPVRD